MILNIRVDQLRQLTIRKIVVLGAIAVACLPPIAMAWYVNSRAGANFGDDYGVYIRGLSQVWNDGLSLRSIVEGAPHGSHFTALPFLIRVVALKLGHWDAFVESFITLTMGVARVALVSAIFSQVLPHIFQRLAILIIVSFLIFAPTQLGLFIYGDTGLTMGTDHLGFLLGLLGCVAFPRSWLGVALMVAGGFLSSWSWGAGVPWVMFFAMAAVTGFRWTHILVLSACCVIAHSQFFFMDFGARFAGARDFFSLRFIIGALGRPFTPAVDDIGDIPGANIIGTAGLAASIVFAAWLLREWFRAKRLPAWSIPSAAFIIYALAYLYQISIVRTTVGAWYVALSVNLWIGLAGVIIASIKVPAFGNRRNLVSSGLAAAAIVAIALLYIPANRSFEHKTPFIQSRTLSSEACQRHYRTAPTFCEMLVFVWPPTYEFASFSRFFEETQTASFAAKQTWTLQGDWPFSAVSLTERPDLPQIQWFGGLGLQSGARPENWQTHNRLSLFIPAGQSVDWRVTFPANATEITLRTDKRKGAGGTLEIVATSEDAVLRSSPAAPVAFDLGALAGRTVTLRFAVSGVGGAYLGYPRIDIRRPWEPTSRVSMGRRDIQGVPENTELAPIDQFPDTPHDVLLDGMGKVTWGQMYYNELKPIGGSVCAGDIDALKITMDMPVNITVRMIRVRVATRKFNGDYREDEIQLPLLQDGSLHKYTIPTKLIPFDKRDRIEMVRLYTLSGAGTEAERQTVISIPEVRLVHSSKAQSFCP